MAQPLLIAQLSDIHIGAEWGEGIDPGERLALAVDAVLALPNPVAAVLVSGDLSDDWGEDSLRRAAGLLERFEAPVHVLPGNHDDRAALRRVFGLPGEGDLPIDYAVEIGGLRVVMLDSTVPPQDTGGFDAGQLRWLDAELSADERPTLLAMHHSPLGTCIDEWDGINLPEAEREALAEVVARHPHLLAIVGGHLHRIAASTLAGRPVLSAPSTFMRALPDFVGEGVEMRPEAPGFLLHAFRDGELSSQVEPIGAA